MPDTILIRSNVYLYQYKYRITISDAINSLVAGLFVHKSLFSPIILLLMILPPSPTTIRYSYQAFIMKKRLMTKLLVISPILKTV